MVSEMTALGMKSNLIAVMILSIILNSCSLQVYHRFPLFKTAFPEIASDSLSNYETNVLNPNLALEATAFKSNPYYSPKPDASREGKGYSVYKGPIGPNEVYTPKRDPNLINGPGYTINKGPVRKPPSLPVAKGYSTTSLSTASPEISTMPYKKTTVSVSSVSSNSPASFGKGPMGSSTSTARPAPTSAPSASTVASATSVPKSYGFAKQKPPQPRATAPVATPVPPSPVPPQTRPVDTSRSGAAEVPVIATFGKGPMGKKVTSSSSPGTAASPVSNVGSTPTSGSNQAGRKFYGFQKQTPPGRR